MQYKRIELPEEQIDSLIEKHISAFIAQHAGPGFEFREYQKEAIVAAIKTFLSGTNKHFLLEAPTGSGKSIIGICVSFVLNALGFTGYILASDLNLQTQYENDFKRLGLDWGSVKGIDNYLCTENGEKHSCGNCHMRNETYSVIKERKCFNDCPYYSARAKAASSETSLLNYSYWLIQMNYVSNTSVHGLFDKRDFIICDEAHKLVDIVQNHFAPMIDKRTAMNIEDIIDEYSHARLWSGQAQIDYGQVVKTIQTSQDKEVLFEKLVMLENVTALLVSGTNYYKQKVSDAMAHGKIDKKMKKTIRLLDWAKDLHCKLEDYIKIISTVGFESMIPCNDKESGRVTFKTLDERFLMEHFFHDVHDFSIMMTATMGNAKTFYDSVKGVDIYSSKACKIPSTFDFTNSPIYSYKGHSMSYKNKDANTPWVVEKVDEILEKHKGQKGIIHCGSYALGNKIYSMSNNKKRILMYKQGEKDVVLDMFKNSDDKVLIGPSILEGVNLEDDMSRFQIFVKVPYASLGDKFVLEKMKVDNVWYQCDAIKKILQGVGRSVRSKDDWAVTYILDGDFIRLWRENSSQFSDEFNERLTFV